MPRLPICWTVSSDAGVFWKAEFRGTCLCVVCALWELCIVRAVFSFAAPTVSSDGSGSCPESTSGIPVGQTKLMVEWQADNTPEAFSFTVSAWQNQGSKGKFHLPRSPLIVLFSISQRSNNVHLWQPTMCPSVSCFQMRSSKRANADGS